MAGHNSVNDANKTAMPIQRTPLAAAGILAAALFVHLFSFDAGKPWLFLIGIGLGMALYHAAFGFTSAYRRAILERDISGVTAQMVMLTAAMLLFAPVLAAGEVFGHGVTGAVAPVSISMAFGALIFGIGMQMGGGCASGTLLTVGGGNLHMLLVLVFFCAGTFWASLDMQWWSSLPGIGAVSLAEKVGNWPAVALQILALLLIYAFLRLLGGRNRRELWWQDGFRWSRLLRGPWPLLLGAGALAVLNWLTLLVAGHPWSITWGFTLWAAKAAVLLGWDPATSTFWSSAFARGALARPLLADTTSVMNIGIVIGALCAASLAGTLRIGIRLSVLPLIAAVTGGLLLGYGARLAYGCNIGAFFSGVASTSLHGWVWIVAAMLGNIIGVRLRPLFRLADA
ncbi:MAG TPA: YeeE/YedE family protein [Pseudomonadales bacterium]